MGYSFYEIYTTSLRALSGMGFPYGADEDAAYIIAWLELNNLNGVNIFKNSIDQIDKQYDAILNFKRNRSKIDFKNKSALMKGSGLIDLLKSYVYNDNKISINVSNCLNGILFLPLLYKANKDIMYLELIFKDSGEKANVFKIYNNKIFYNTEEINIQQSEIKITLSNQSIIEANNFYDEILNKKIIQDNLSKSLEPNKDNWNMISVIANRTFVPESEESRNKGAGGGDAND